MRAKENDRLHERDYLDQLGGIQWEIEYWKGFMEKHDYRQFYAPMVEALKHRELLLRQALQQPILPPLPDELRNPFDIPPTPDETEFIETTRLYFGGLKDR